MSTILRHKPEKFGVRLDANGWTAVDELISALNAHDAPITRADLDRIVATSDKKRFTLSECGTRIRAAQGHSVPVDLQLQPARPPDELYHGTTTSNLEAILTEGLSPRTRRQVHLSLDAETAAKVGARHGPPAVLLIEAGVMFADGLQFYCADNGVWLTDAVPPEYLRLLQHR